MQGNAEGDPSMCMVRVACSVFYVVLLYGVCCMVYVACCMVYAFVVYVACRVTGACCSLAAWRTLCVVRRSFSR